MLFIFRAAPQRVIEKTTVIRGGGGGFGGGGFGRPAPFRPPPPRFGPSFGRPQTTIVKQTIIRG